MPGGYKTEYAKSGRSTCKGCKQLIAQGALRIGKMVQSPHFDGEMPLWHHRACLFKREAVASAMLLEGLEDLRPEDAKALKEQCGVGKSVGGLGGGGGAGVLPPSLADDRFTVEYAKSGRSVCKGCGEKIAQEELRVGKMVKSETFDGTVVQWHHVPCIFKSTVVYNAALVDNLDSLRPEDQRFLKEEIVKHSPASKGDAAAAAAAKDADGDVAMKPKPASTKGKGKKRAKDPDSDFEEAPAAKAVKPSAQHYSTFTVAALQAQCKLSGLKATGKKAELIARLDEAMAAAGGGAAVAVAAAASVTVSAPVDPVAAAHEAAIEAEAAAKWKIKDAIRDLSTGELKALLQANNQPDNGGRDTLMGRLVDGLLYGALPACSECSNSSLIFRNGQYECTGMASEWGRCLYTAPDVKRTEFDVSESDHAYLTSNKFKQQKKPLAAYAYMASLNKAAAEEHKAAASAAEEAVRAHQQQLLRQSVLDELFSDFTVAFVGSKGFKGPAGEEVKLKELKSLVESHGGSVSSSVDDADLVITTPEDVAADSNKKLKKAHSEKKPILLATFIMQSVAKAELQEPKDYSALTDASDNKAESWTGLATKVQSGRQKSGAKLAGGSSAAASASGVGKKSGGAKVTLKVKGRGAVDPDSGLDETGHILEEGSDVYTFTGSLSDVTTGTNSYYILQLIEMDTAKRYHVFRKWGRVGTDVGFNKITDHGSSKEDALAEFKEVFEEKTGNLWHQRSTFVKKPRKFMLVDVDYSGDDDPLAAAQAASDAPSRSKLDKPIQDLIRTLFDVQAIKQTLLSMDIDLDKMPLGKLSRSHIKSGYSVLTAIQEAIKAERVDESKLLALSNQFYTLIPHDFGLAAPTILRTEEEIKSKIEMIETLLEIETATKLLKEGAAKTDDGAGGDSAAAAAASDTAVGQSNDPIDVHYRQLKTDMSTLSHDSDEFKLVQTFITNTHAPTHKNYTLDLLEAFSVDRHNEGARYADFEKDPNRMLLWHGSRTTNFVGILSQGLRIAPPEAPVTGYMFGKGVYFADLVSKSANYCFTSASNNIGFLLLCEVALGEMNLLKNAQYMEKVHTHCGWHKEQAPGSCLSTKGLGSTAPDPAGNITLPNGCVVPAGKPVKTPVGSSLLYNEVSQIRMKYLLKVRFNYAGRW